MYTNVSDTYYFIVTCQVLIFFIGFAKSVAIKRNWAKQDDKIIKKAMAQKLVELKRLAKKNTA